MSLICSICGLADDNVRAVHYECIVHKHEEPTGPPIPLRQEDWAEMWTRWMGLLNVLADAYPWLRADTPEIVEAAVRNNLEAATREASR